MTIVIVILFCLAIVFSIVWYAWACGITPTPTSPKVTQKLLEIAPELKEGLILELGSGWGTLARSLARHYPSCHVQAYEISLIPFLVSKIFQLFGRTPNLQITRLDFFQVSFAKADLIVCYLYPAAMIQLKTKFQRELKPSACVISHTFAVPGWQPYACVKANDLYRTPVYLYSINFFAPRLNDRK